MFKENKMSLAYCNIMLTGCPALLKFGGRFTLDRDPKLGHNLSGVPITLLPRPMLQSINLRSTGIADKLFV